MGRIDEEMFENATQGANLKANKKDQPEEIQRYSSVYDVPKTWLTAIKSNKWGVCSFSGYAKVAIYEKLIKDGLLKD
jgi:hypothetical protein